MLKIPQKQEIKGFWVGGGSFTCRRNFMKRFFLFSAFSMAAISFCGLIPVSIHAQSTGSMTVDSATVCKGVLDRQAIEAGSSFPASVGKLYCFSKITGIQNPTEIVHVWFHGDTERARISLAVQPPAWRTYSVKTIHSTALGAWRIEILDGSGNVLTTVRFEITP
jgi:hypothetical protein